MGVEPSTLPLLLEATLSAAESLLASDMVEIDVAFCELSMMMVDWKLER